MVASRHPDVKEVLMHEKAIDPGRQCEVPIDVGFDLSSVWSLGDRQ